MPTCITNAQSYLGAAGYLSKSVGAIERAATNAQAARAAFEATETFKMASPERQREAIKERAAEWERPVREAEALARENAENAAGWVAELTVYAAAAPPPPDHVLQRANLVRAFVEADVADAHTPDEAAALVDAARIEEDRGRLWVAMRAARRRAFARTGPDSVAPGFSSAALRLALAKAEKAFEDPARARAGELAAELTKATTAARVAIAKALTEAFGEAAAAGQSALYKTF